MTKRQIVIGGICFLAGILVGMELAGNLDTIVRLAIVLAILLLCVYLMLPYLPQRTRSRRSVVQRAQQRQTQKKRSRV